MNAFGSPWQSICVTIFLCLVACTTSDSAGTGNAPAEQPAEPEPSRFILDDEGGALILHGLNISGDAKYDELRQPWVEREDVLRVSRDWGMNFSRYLLLWDAIEPEPGVIDQGYLDLVEERLDWHYEAGLHVVLDMHQDLYSNFLCPPGDGAPAWAIETDGHPYPNPDEYTEWETYHLSPAVQAAFENFFDYEGDHPELQDHYIAMWGAVIERFKDHPAVLGYEIMNEPYSTHSLADPDAYDTEWLAPFYRRFIEAARAIDTDGWIFYEPQAFVVSDGNEQALPRFEDPREGLPRLVFFPHLYLLAAINNKDDHAKLQRGLERYETNRMADAERYGTPLAIGEFHSEQGSDIPDFFPWYIHEELALFDRMGAGWSYWDHAPSWNLIDENGDERPLAGHLTRVYPRRVAGEPSAYAYDPATRIFELEYRDRVGAEGATEIYIPESRHYPDGWALTVSDAAGQWEQLWDAEHEILTLNLPKTDGAHTIRIEPQ